MLNKYFFIPANNEKFLAGINKIKADYIVFDLEDSILMSEYDLSIRNLLTIKIKDNYFVRLKFFNEIDNSIEEKKINQLIQLGFKNFVIPKFSKAIEVKRIEEYFSKSNKLDLKFILLVEGPSGLFELNKAMSMDVINIVGVGFGSHDYCNTMKIRHHKENFSFARQYVLNIAKAFNVEAIDIACLNLEDVDAFKQECIDGFNLGFDGKFLIHPNQLDEISNIKYFSKEDVDDAIQLYRKIQLLEVGKKSVLRIDGKVYEKPHIDRIKNIVEWSEKNDT